MSVPMKDVKTAAVLVLVKNGSKYEKKQESGISHFIEHMLFKGSSLYPTEFEVAEALDKIGGKFNAFTGKEHTGYWAKVNSLHLKKALRWISDIYLHPKMDSEDVEREKGVIIEEINMYLDTPRVYIEDVWEKLLYGDQPAGRRVLGEKETIERVSSKKMKSFFESHYLAQNTVVVLAGNFKEGEGLKLAEKYFKKVRDGSSVSKEAVEEEQNSPGFLMEEKRTDQNHLALGVRGFNMFDEERFAQAVLAKVLGGMMSSRLFLKIRGAGLAYNVYTTSQNYTDSGYLTTLAGVDKDKTKQAASIILEEYKKVKEKGISAEELQRGKEYLKGSLALSLESSSEQASFFGKQEVLKEEVLTPEEVSKKIDEVSLKDVKETARHIFKPKNLNLALIGKTKENLKEILSI